MQTMKNKYPGADNSKFKNVYRVDHRPRTSKMKTDLNAYRNGYDYVFGKDRQKNG